MRIVNQTLSDLKVYARKEYDLNHNVPILVMLITEEESNALRECHNSIVKGGLERNIPLVDSSKDAQVPLYSADFLPNVAATVLLMHNTSTNNPSIITPLLRVFEIPNFAKYKYAIIIREKKLLEWVTPMTIEANGVPATEKVRKTCMFFNILTHELLHIVELEKNIRIYASNKHDSEELNKAMKNVKFFQNVKLFSE